MPSSKILVVEDDETTRKVIELQLKNMGYEVIEGTPSADDAIEKAAEHSPDLVLMDINLGKGQDGIDTARIIMGKNRIPVVFITAYGTDDNLDRAKKINPAGFINKPVRENDLHANIEIALQRQTLLSAAGDQSGPHRIQSKPLQIVTDADGTINKLTVRAEQTIVDYQVDSVYDLLPRDHKTHVENCLKHQKPQMLTGKFDKYIFSWEYQPMQSGNSVRILIQDITNQYGTAVLDVEGNSLSEALDHLASGVMLVNEHMKIFYSNRSAERFFKGNSVLINKDGYLSCNTPSLTAELHRLVLKDTGDTLTVSRNGGNKNPLHIFVSPLHSRAANYGHDLPIAVIFLFETINDSERVEDVIRTLYDLSPSEARMAAMLVFNPHLEEVAKSLGITYNTARTHLKRIYLKTGTNRLSALVHRIMTGPVGILIHSRG